MELIMCIKQIILLSFYNLLNFCNNSVHFSSRIFNFMTNINFIIPVPAFKPIISLLKPLLIIFIELFTIWFQDQSFLYSIPDYFFFCRNQSCINFNACLLQLCDCAINDNFYVFLLFWIRLFRIINSRIWGSISKQYFPLILFFN